jgi:hypothetical protein
MTLVDTLYAYNGDNPVSTSPAEAPIPNAGYAFTIEASARPQKVMVFATVAFTRTLGDCTGVTLTCSFLRNGVFQYFTVRTEQFYQNAAGLFTAPIIALSDVFDIQPPATGVDSISFEWAFVPTSNGTVFAGYFDATYQRFSA